MNGWPSRSDSRWQIKREYLLGDGGRNVTGTVMTIDAGNTA
jgi:hypothetical protein